jgi:protoporphyrinogen oxidase
MGERVARVDLPRVLANIERREDDVAWGPNATFRFPLHGGTGAIWRATYERLPPGRVLLGTCVRHLDLGAHELELKGGLRVPYDAVISTMPLDRLLQSVPGRADLHNLSREFVHSSSHIVGIGVHGQPPPDLQTKCWMYFPEDHAPFYRVTVFSNYSPNNVARPGEQWSLMAEVSESRDKPVDHGGLVDEVVHSLKTCKLLRESDQIVSRWHRRLEYGYPTPWLGRDAVLEQAEALLREHDVFSRGRFGAWKYEVSNQDHSVMQGVEAVNRILRGAPERTYHGDMSD